MTNCNTIATMTATIAARYITDGNDHQDITLSCKAYVKGLTIAQVNEAYNEALALGLVKATPKKRRHVTMALVMLVTQTRNSHFNNHSRKNLRGMATAMGVTVRNGREKARFVAAMTVSALATSAGTLLA